MHNLDLNEVLMYKFRYLNMNYLKICNMSKFVKKISNTSLLFKWKFQINKY